MQKMICVLGNNDWYNRQYPLEIITTLNGKKFFICHGHKYNVKYGTELVKKKGISEKADVILYGHTHRRFIEEKDGLLIMNPGSTASYGIINIDEKGTITADILEV
jgi:putative phosphoesterase